MSILHHSWVLGSALAFASHIRALHKKIRDEIMILNTNSKASTNFHRRLRSFNIGDYVMARLRPERFPPGAVKKLHARNAGRFQSARRSIQLFMW